MDFINTYRQSSATKVSRNSMTWVSAEKGMLSEEADSNHLVEKKNVSSTFKMAMVWKAIVIAMFIAVSVNLSFHETEKGDNFMNDGIDKKTRNLVSTN